MADLDVTAWARQIAESAARIARDSVPAGMTRREATVTRVGSDGTVDVNIGSEDRPQALLGLRMTTACAGAAVGSRVLVETLNNVSYVTGVLANADNVPYVGARIYCGTKVYNSPGDHVDVTPGFLGLPFTDIAGGDVLYVCNGDASANNFMYSTPRHYVRASPSFDGWIVMHLNHTTGQPISFTGLARMNWAYFRY